MFENEFYLNFFRPSISTPIYYITKFLSFWSSTLLFIPINFGSLCFSLKYILLKSTKELIRKKNMPYQYLFETYDEISKLISHVNRKMQSFLLSIFTILLLNIFYSAYNVVFTECESVSSLIYYWITIISYYIMFVLMCLFSSSVTNAAVGLEDMMLSQSIGQNRELQFLLKVKGRFVGFTLLDSLVINKNLILSATGSLLTYGLMVATFNANSGS